MTSISVQAPDVFLQNIHGPSSPPQHMSAHARRKSRSVAASLPSFTFNPGHSEQQPVSPIDDGDVATMGSLRRASKPPALPEFKFNPGAALPTDDRPSPTHPVLEEMVLNQQRIARSARPAPLPAFTFTPGINSQITPSPTRTDFSESYLGRPTGGHKRAGSEFVGGGGTDGATLISTSPQKHEARPSGSLHANAGRRGHMHRRSQAVSISDIDTSDLIKINAIARARTESEPRTGTTTPVETPPVPPFSQSGSPQMRPHYFTPTSPHRRGSTAGSRPRVEFADKIDVIPRPLSMISSETEGSCSTARYSHSLNNSINSIASPSARSSFSSPVLEESPIARPKTADFAILSSMSSSTNHSDTEHQPPARPSSAAETPSTENVGQSAKRKHFWFGHSPDRSPLSTPRAEQVDPFNNYPEFQPAKSLCKTRPKTSPERSASVQKRKYHTWSTGIFHKKTKQRTSEPKFKRPPIITDAPQKGGDQVNEIFDADDTIVLRSDSPELKRVQPKLNTNIAPVIFMDTNILQEVTSPVLDLDDALGSFNCDERFTSESQNRSAASRIAKLHSSERRGIVDAFGVMHRRTESAPSMPAFNRGNTGITRHASNPSLAEDVFDEQEEDNFLANQKKALRNSDTQSRTNNYGRSSLSTQALRHSGLGLSHVVKASDGVVIVDTDDDVVDVVDEDSSNSTVDGPMFVETDLGKRPMSSPMPFAWPSTQSHYASSTEGRTTTTASIISSPDTEHLHFDASRLTPTVSQHSPDIYLRPSNEDLPSLSDSISSGVIPRVSSSANTRSSIDHSYEQRYEHRSSSMFVPGTSRSNQPSWKRSSLASLNRLIPGSANGSRLKFESTPDLGGDDKTKKRSNRLSKLVTFWRPKDKVLR